MKYSYICILVLILLYSCREASKTPQQKNPFFNRAYDFYVHGQTDSAFLYYSRAKDIFLSSNDSSGAGQCLIYMGIISNKTGDYYGAQELSLSAISYLHNLDTLSRQYLTTNYNNLGMATHQLKEDSDAIHFYDAALKLSVDSSSTLLALNNKAKSLEDLKDYKGALTLYNQVLESTINNKIEYARTLTNISYTRWLQNNNYNPVPSYLKAMHIRKEQDDLWGLNSSYYHLADYYKLKNVDSSFLYANKMYEIANKLNSIEDQVEALKRLIKVTDSRNLKGYFEIFDKLNESLQTSRQKDKKQFALIRYETEKHKADYLRSQAENIQKKNDILRRNIVVCILASGFIVAYLWYRKRKRSLQQEKEMEVKNTEIKYVKAVHDQVANKVYQVLTEVDNSSELDREDLLDQLDDLYRVTRDISYDVNMLDLSANYVEQLYKMIKSYKSNKVGINTVGNEDEVWCDVSDDVKKELYYILQELLTNMKKHSKADAVVLKFRRAETSVHITYLDNGIGMNDAVKKNGLSNTENRINHIRGTINFDSRQENELRIDISFPFSY